MPLAAYYAWSFALVPATRSLNRMSRVFPERGLRAQRVVPGRRAGRFPACGGGTADVRVGGTCAFRPRELGAAGWVVGIWAALAVAFVPYLIVNWGVVRSYKDCEGLIPTPASWLTGRPGLAGTRRSGPARRIPRDRAGFRPWVSDERYLFCGFGVYALMLTAVAHLFVVRREGRPPEFVLAAAALITAAVWGLIALAPYNGGPSLWQIVRFLPGGTAIRNVARVYVTVYLFGVLGALVWLNAVTAQLRPLVRTAVLGLIAAAIVFEQTGANQPSFEKPDFYAIVDQTAEQLRGADAGYVIPRYTDSKGDVKVWGESDVMAMWAGLRANVPVVNGYSGRGPLRPHPRDIVVTDAILRDWFASHFRGKVAIVTPDDLTTRA